ncbi:low temperature requirement protein A [Amycolatopsis sp. NPDC024027]|uniref:low temperature requirement protein A n=1 Tax=Amycolatopsis sp. NPDC024027 TaxID=3154327 RepID=UPI0033ECF794
MPPTNTRIRIRVRMSARPIDEPHRASSQLELLFDLVFVVAVAAATAQLAHHIADGHAWTGLTGFLHVFFAIWWAWMNFTWCASSYDTDDVAYRLLTMVQMAGVLVLAAGVPATAGGDYRAVAAGYLVMRIGLVTQWLRAGLEDPARRRTAFRYATGITVLQIGWVGWLLLGEAGVLSPGTRPVCFLALAAAELAVPRWVERPGATTWHPHHIAERYGLFTIILLGESVLAAITGVRGALQAAEISAAFVTIAVSGLVLLFATWWLYFLEPAGAGLSDRRGGSYLWGYGHFGIFAALAALGASLEVAVEDTGHHLPASPLLISYAVAASVGVFLVLLWLVHVPIVATAVLRPGAVLACATVVFLLPLAAPWTGVAVVVAGIAAACAVLVAFTIALERNLS